MERWRRVQSLLERAALPIAWITLTSIALIPVWHQRLLPQLDTPNHLALVRGWHSFSDPSFHISDFYTLRIRPVPYFLFYLVIHLLMFVCSIEIANKLFLSAYLILFPLSILSLARALKRSPWLALGAFPLAFSQNWIYGFSSYLMGTTFMFFSLAALLRWLDGESRRNLIILGVCCTLAYFGHVMPWACFGACAIALVILYRRHWRRCLWAALAMSPSVMFAAGAYIAEKRAHTYFKAGDGLTALSAIWHDVPTLLRDFPRRIMELFPGNADRNVLITITLTVLVLALWKGVHLPDETREQRARIKLILSVLFGLYLVLPYNILKPMAWWYVAPRVPSMMAPFLLLLPAIRLDGWKRVLVAPLVVAAFVIPLTLARLYRDFSNRNTPFMSLVEMLPKGQKVLVVVRGMMRDPNSEEKSGDPSTSAPVYWHFSSWPMALKGGYGPYIFNQGVPIVPKLKLRAPPWSNTDTFELRQAPDFDYYIVRNPSQELERAPSLRVVERINEWVLYKRIGELTDEP
jgi:hypothetical protein